MEYNRFVNYLNSLHNYGAKNKNAYAEKNITSEFYDKVVVRSEICDFLIQKLSGEENLVIVLTGHAGDGKTSLQYQVMQELAITLDMKKDVNDVMLPDGRKCRCIKDFSEWTGQKRNKVMEEAIAFYKAHNFVFLVANTGPLIHTFETIVEHDDQEQMKLIEAMDENAGEVTELAGVKFCVINVAGVDNTSFAEQYLKRLTAETLWNPCESCEKKAYCHIYTNCQLIAKNQNQVLDFLKKHYIWQTQYGERMTIRSMTEQLAYMITGGVSCENCQPNKQFAYLFPHLFFGYLGTQQDSKAQKLLAVKAASKQKYDKKRLDADEMLFLHKDYDKVFGREVTRLIEYEKQHNQIEYQKGYSEAIRRMYYFLNIVTDKRQKQQDCKDIFSKNYERYLTLCQSEEETGNQEKQLVLDALSMMYMGKCARGDIPFTLKRENGLTQNVQLVMGMIPSRSLKIKKVKAKGMAYNATTKRYQLAMEMNRRQLQTKLTLPMMNYFEELREGIIATSIDPQLSHGVESLKAEIKECVEENNDYFEMISLSEEMGSGGTVCLEWKEDRISVMR